MSVLLSTTDADRTFSDVSNMPNAQAPAPELPPLEPPPPEPPLDAELFVPLPVVVLGDAPVSLQYVGS